MASVFEKYLDSLKTEIESDLSKVYKQNGELFITVLEDCKFSTDYLTADIFMFNSLMTRTNNLNEALKILDDAKNARIQPDVTTFNILMGKVDNFDSSWEIYQDMLQTGIEPNKFSFYPLFKQADNFDSFWKTYQEMLQREIQPDKVSIYTLFKQADNFDSCWKTYQEMLQTGIQPDKPSFYSTLLKTSCNFDQAKEVFKSLLSSGYQPNMRFVRSLLEKINQSKKNKDKAFNEEAMYVHEQMCKLGILHSPYTLQKILDSAPDFKTAWSLYKALERDKKIGTVSQGVFTKLISKAITYEQAQEPFQKMLSLNILMTVNPFNTLMQKAPNFDIAWSIFEQILDHNILDHNINCDKFTFDALIRKTTNVKQKDKVLEYIKDKCPELINDLQSIPRKKIN